jgi:hypothetical protein
MGAACIGIHSTTVSGTQTQKEKVIGREKDKVREAILPHHIRVNSHSVPTNHVVSKDRKEGKEGKDKDAKQIKPIPLGESLVVHTKNKDKRRWSLVRDVHSLKTGKRSREMPQAHSSTYRTQDTREAWTGTPVASPFCNLRPIDKKENVREQVPMKPLQSLNKTEPSPHTDKVPKQPKTFTFPLQLRRLSYNDSNDSANGTGYISHRSYPSKTPPEMYRPFSLQAPSLSARSHTSRSRHLKAYDAAFESIPQTPQSQQGLASSQQWVSDTDQVCTPSNSAKPPLYAHEPSAVAFPALIAPSIHASVDIS